MEFYGLGDMEIVAAYSLGDPDLAITDVKKSEITNADAIWFLDLMEMEDMSRLSSGELDRLLSSKLREKSKHKYSVLFDDDMDFIFRTDILINPLLDVPLRENGKHIVRETCKVLVECYRTSLEEKASRSCIWSALLDRALFHIRRAGFHEAKTGAFGPQQKEVSLFVDDYHISRSNLRKIIVELLGSSSTIEMDSNDR